MTALSTNLGIALLSSLLLIGASPRDPVGWRADGTGYYKEVNPPTKWAEDTNVLWKTKLPGRSQASPILIGKRIFVVSDPAELLCVNAADGKILWRRSNDLVELYGEDKAKQITAEYARLKTEKRNLERERGRVKGDADKEKEIKQKLEAVNREVQQLRKRAPAPPSYADGETTNTAATPASDGEHVYAVFGNGVVCAYTVAGERRWIKYIEAPTIGFGHSSSPALADGKLIVHLNDLFALETATGEIAWRVPLPARHASPLVTRVDETSVVVSPAGAIVRLADGKILLKDGSLSSSECSPVLHDRILYTFPGGARAVRLVSAKPASVKLEKLWESKTAGGRRTPSPVLYDGLLYGVTTDGTLDVLDASTGEQVYRQRLGIGNLYSSITAAGTNLYFSSTKGTTIVVAPGREYHEVARNTLEGFGSCPIFSERHMFVRTRQHLYCIGR
ncbi:MAG TPA: PQQ-binding-like beta-propeller repeat protein [Gemmataceae bacterium]|nr:PQQ-binding-like beta-propeller repeat protein [Gemmataceae bacterium]